MRERFSWIRTTEGLETVSPEWRALWIQDAHATPFQTPEWLVPWWHCFGGDLRTLCIHLDDALIGLLPFYLHREPLTGERQLLPLGVGTSDYLDGVFAPGCTVEHIKDAVELLCREDDWDALYASQLRPESKLLEALRRAARNGDGCTQGQSCSRMPALTIPQLPQKLRSNVRYYRNRAQRSGNLDMQIANGSNWPEMLNALVRLHTLRWRDRGEPGVFADDRVVRWHYEAMPLLERAGLLRLSSLRLDGEFIAAIYSLVDSPMRPNRTQYIYIPAFSTSHAELRPGTVLTALTIEHAAQEGVQAIDMLRGDEDYKKLWHTRQAHTFGFVRYREACRAQKHRAGEIAA